MWGSNNLNALLKRIDTLSNNPAAAAEPIATCAQALDRMSKQSHPEQWALVHQYRGTALVRLGEIGGDPALMRKAIAALDETLTVFTRKSRPADWAVTLQNRANALFWPFGAWNIR